MTNIYAMAPHADFGMPARGRVSVLRSLPTRVLEQKRVLAADWTGVSTTGAVIDAAIADTTGAFPVPPAWSPPT